MTTVHHWYISLTPYIIGTSLTFVWFLRFVARPLAFTLVTLQGDAQRRGGAPGEDQDLLQQ